jgi:hypothetical protein
MQANASETVYSENSVSEIPAIAEKRTSNMTAANLLRIASLFALVQYSAHALLFLTRTLGRSPNPIALIAASSAHSYWDFYFGYGLLAILSGVVEIILLWQLASIAKKHAGAIRPVVALFIMANLAHAFVVWRYFSLAAPIVFDLVIAMLLAFALVLGQRRQIETSASH